MIGQEYFEVLSQNTVIFFEALMEAKTQCDTSNSFQVFYV